MGRVNHMLERRLSLLAEVERLAVSLGLAPDIAYTCETACNAFSYHIIPRWRTFERGLQQRTGAGAAAADADAVYVRDQFPFHVYFSNAPQPLFAGRDFAADAEIARCVRGRHRRRWRAAD